MNNDDVKILQQLLINEGFWNSDASVFQLFWSGHQSRGHGFPAANSDWILKPYGPLGADRIFRTLHP